jgi:type VI secretion system protein ImpK
MYWFYWAAGVAVVAGLWLVLSSSLAHQMSQITGQG